MGRKNLSIKKIAYYASIIIALFFTMLVLGNK